ncbi:actin-related protein 5 isoform X2 [Lycorma delicatula]|uniref:actin-related protein 5 isoform X2 n=1 Tax=Lycorma delicatula TaxID=130591 RepID=UPI003F51407D
MVMEILELKDAKTVPDLVHFYSAVLHDNATPLVIDNGSYNCRVGWATLRKPLMIFKNLIAKPRKERGKKDGEAQVGNDILNIEAVRFQLKTQFDRNVVTHYEAQEQILDYIFSHLGIDTEGSVDHPIVLTEPFLNPNYSRTLMSELLFECYRVPGVCFGVDSLFSFWRHHKTRTSGLIISCSYHCTHVLPVIDGVVDSAHSRRINIGGYHMISYLHRLLQLKYPSHFAAITPSRAEELLHDHCSLARDYQEELKNWSDCDYYERHVRRIQLPYSAPAATSLTADQQRERRKELARRLIEINARKREEKLAEDEEQLNQLLAVQDLEDEGDEEELQESLKCFELQNTDELRRLIGQIQLRIERTRQKIVAANAGEDSIEEPKPKVMKQIPTPRDDEDFKQWVDGVRKKRQEILDKRTARRQRRADMAKRRTAAAQERMRLISQLARKEKRDDDFGMRDEDWDVYKAINKEGGDSDSDEEAEKLLELEEVLRQHDPAWVSGGEVASTPREAHQLHVGVELIRAPELLFQPSMIGSPQAGLAETIEYVLHGYDESTAAAITGNVFVTGGCALIPGLYDRLNKELMEMRPFKSEFNVRIISEAALDAWLGAREFAECDEFSKGLITRQDYLDKGGEYLKEHCCSNIYTPSPVPLVSADNVIIQNTSVNEEIEAEAI